LQFQLQKHAGQALEAQPEFTQLGDDKIITSTRWTTPDGQGERYQVITFRDGKIRDLQGCRSRREAQRFARRHKTS
jgi:hypothetical protein